MAPPRPPGHLPPQAEHRCRLPRPTLQFCHEWDEAKSLPKSLFEKASAAGWLPVCVGAWPTVRQCCALLAPARVLTSRPWSQSYVGEPPEELRKMDYFHELVLIDELSRCGSGGVLWGLFGGLSIGAPLASCAAGIAHRWMKHRLLTRSLPARQACRPS